MPTALDPEQRKVLRTIRRVGRRKGATPKLLKAAIETGLVESSLRNLKGGDADSAGWRQERASLYPDPTNVRRSAARFFDEAARANAPGISAGELAARVQRPAAQYRGRYEEAAQQAEAILESLAAGSSEGDTPLLGMQRVESGSKTVFDKQGFEGARKKLVLAQMLAKHGKDSPLFKTGLLSTTAPDRADFTSSKQTSRVVATASGANLPRGGGAGTGAVAFASQRIGRYQENRGANRGTDLDRLQARFGMTGQPWCAIFATTSAAHGGASRAVRTASVAQINQWAQEGSHGYHRGLLSSDKAKPGDLLTFGNDHVGVVEKRLPDGRIRTIEGNTSTGGVRRVTRRPGEGMIARPRYRR